MSCKLELVQQLEMNLNSFVSLFNAALRVFSCSFLSVIPNLSIREEVVCRYWFILRI
jgi:hypothetical protein